MEKREKPWNRVFHIVEKENCVYNKSLWIFVKEKNVRIWIGYRKRHIREQRNKEWSRAMVRWSADDIIYEDEQILVCRKHSGMAVQSARVGQMDLERELRNYRNGNYIGIVQRLVQPVEGVLVFGKTPQATAWLNKQHQNGMMKKEYLAVFTGTPVKEKQGIWEDYLIKDGKTNTSRVTGKKDRMAKKAVLSYRIMDWRDDRGLAEIQLGTGRHHQILVQMAHHGMPLWADGKYKKKEEMLEAEQGTAIGLCAWRLEFAHPKTGKKMKFEVQPEGACFQEFSEAIKP